MKTTKQPIDCILYDGEENAKQIVKVIFYEFEPETYRAFIQDELTFEPNDLHADLSFHIEGYGQLREVYLKDWHAANRKKYHNIDLYTSQSNVLFI